MTAPWWEQPVVQGKPPTSRRLIENEFGLIPKLLEDSAANVAKSIQSRRVVDTPDWNDPTESDAGSVLVRLFSEQATPVLRRANRLPEKTFVEFLNLAGIRQATARPAEAMVEFTVAEAARQSVLIAQGFQIGASPADGRGDMVIFETQDDLYATSAKLDQVVFVRRSLQRDLTKDNESEKKTFRPFGDDPQVGDVLLLGLSESAIPTTSLSLGVSVASAPGAPPPVSSGGVAPIPLPLGPVLRWEALEQSNFEPVEVESDDTRGLWRSGVVTLRLPRDWKAETFLGKTAHWLRLRLVHGGFEKPPELLSVRLNMTSVRAVRTYREEVLESQPGDPPNRLRLRHTPVVPKSLVLTVDASPLDFDPSDAKPWEEVDDLADQQPSAHVFTLDHATGEITFGDGTHGAALPPGFRHVLAVKYAVGTGRAGAVDHDAIKTMINSAPFVTGATNPLRASGGVDKELRRDALINGPATIRSRRRAVTVADYALLARLAPGADVRRAHAIAGWHALFPGQVTPGVVGVFVVPFSESGPPIPDAAALRAVGKYLTEEVAPVGVEVVAAAPKYRRIRSEVGIQLTRGADVGETVNRLIGKLSDYLDPVQGGEQQQGWPFGRTLRFARLLRLLLDDSSVLSVPHLRLIVDGVSQTACADIQLGPTELFWPESHQIIPTTEETQR